MRNREATLRVPQCFNLVNNGRSQVGHSNAGVRRDLAARRASRQGQSALDTLAGYFGAGKGAGVVRGTGAAADEVEVDGPLHELS